VFPDVKRGAEECSNVVSRASATQADKLLISRTSRIIIKIESNVSEFADMRRSRANFAFLVDDRLVVLQWARVEREHGPTVFDRKKRRQSVVDQTSAELGLEWIDVEFRVTIQVAMRSVAAIFVHRTQHQQAKTIGHSAPSMSCAPETCQA